MEQCGNLKLLPVGNRATTATDPAPVDNNNSTTHPKSETNEPAKSNLSKIPWWAWVMIGAGGMALLAGKKD